ncbi:hypothetical protein WA026_006641 [Henosepilachna vigintioctopunctata]|uniref:Uncharacterized protein n=1 Tax=Henosepilachna vigintioctopunctata TaxID=420089 RepID=A0AAW1UFK0_9CUCU
MRWLPSILLLLVGPAICTEEDSNEVVIGSSIKPPINLDTNLRKALLKALIELEHEDKEQYNRNRESDYVNIITHLDSKDKNVERASASAVSYITKSQPINMTITVKKTTSKPKHTVIVQKSKSSNQDQSDKDDLDVSETPEQFIASASNNFASKKVKSEKRNNVKASSLNSLNDGVKSNKFLYEKTTTIKPTTSTEESEANVESLQFFSAPLVAAFTVHQDEKGLPKKVVPIYNQSGSKHLEKVKKGSNDSGRNVINQPDLNNRPADELRQRQKKLEEEIRRLKKLQEEQERIIKEQKFAYEQKIFEQQQKLFAEQTRLLKNIQPFVPITSTPKTSSQSLNQLNNLENSRNNAGTLVSIQPSVGFVQPAATSSPFALNTQILPLKNAIDFRTPFSQNFRLYREQNNIIPNSPNSLSTTLNTGVPLGLTVINDPSANTIQQGLRQNSQNVNFFQSLPTVQHTTFFRPLPSVSHTTSQSLPLTSLAPAFRVSELPREQHGTRNLRQEVGTGNFLNNNNLSRNPPGVTDLFTDHRFNRNPFVGVQRPTEFPKTNSFGSPINPINIRQYNTLQYSVDEPLLNQRLNNLLYHSGLSNGRQQEDLNIVSKVLSLNHLGSADPQFTSTTAHNPIIRPFNNWRVQ